MEIHRKLTHLTCRISDYAKKLGRVVVVVRLKMIR